MSDIVRDTLWVIKIQRDKDTQLTKDVEVKVMNFEDVFPGPHRDAEPGARAGKKGYTLYWGVTKIEAINHYVRDKQRLREQAKKMFDRADMELATALKVRNEHGETGKQGT